MATLWTTVSGAYIVHAGDRKDTPELGAFRPDGTGWWAIEYPNGQRRMIFHKHDRTEQAELAAAKALAWKLFGP
ncbi:hypothetical protein ACQEU3_46540 [Spirillospora sp. CA-253888]